MIKCLFVFFISSSLFPNVFSQEINLLTEFSQNGVLYDDLFNDTPKPLTEFKKNDVCAVTDYLGKDLYKIDYKNFSGFVKAEYLLVNDSMIDLVIAHEDSLRIEAIANEEKRKHKIQQSLRRSEEEKLRDEEEFSEGRKKDSITKLLMEDKLIKEIEELARIKEIEELNNIRKLNSITITVEEARPNKEIEEKQIKSEEQLNRVANIANEYSKSQTIKFRDTCYYVTNEFDPFYGIKTIRTEPYSISDNLDIELFKQGQNLNVFFNLKENLGCASYLSNTKSYVKIILENNDVIAIFHSWDMNCEDFSLKGKLSNTNLEKLKKSPIGSITLQGTKNSRDITNIAYKEFFMDKLKCMD